MFLFKELCLNLIRQVALMTLYRIIFYKSKQTCKVLIKISFDYYPRNVSFSELNFSLLPMNRAFTKPPTFVAAFNKVVTSAAKSEVHMMYGQPTATNKVTVKGSTTSGSGELSWMACGN